MADQRPFSETTPVSKDRDGKNLSQTFVIGELKQKAIKHWVLRFVGTKRYSSFEPFVKTDITDRFVVNYRIGRLETDKNVWELSGKLDNDGLKRWIRITEQRLGQGPLSRPVLVVTSSYPPVSVEKTGTKIIEVPLASLMQRLGLKLSKTQNFGLSEPPRISDGVKSFGEKLSTAEFGVCLWFHFTAASKLETLIYLSNPARLVIVQEHALPLSTEALTPQRIQTFLEETIPKLQTELEGLIGAGSLNSKIFRLKFVGLDSFAKFKLVDRAIGLLDPVTHVQLKAAVFQSAEYEVSSSLTLEDFAGRIGTFTLGEFGLKLEGRDGSTLVLRPVSGG